MAAITRFKTTEPVPVIVNKKSSFDANYWRGLQFPTTIKEYGAVTNIDFQLCEPNYFAVSASNRVKIYNPETEELVKSFSRFRSTAYGASFRSDGNLLVSGNEDGSIRLFDVGGRIPLRTFNGHKMPTHVAKFNCQTQIFSASDDKSVRVWDVACEETVNVFSGHEDYIRCGLSTRNPNIIFTGSYDHTIRMFDTRTGTTSMAFNHGCPVESILLFPSGGILLSAGGNHIKVWDILQAGKHLATVSHHHKTITCMSFNHDCTRLLSGGLDRHVKIYDVATYSVVHNIDYPGSILSMGVSHDDRTLVVGMTDKMLSIRHRRQPALAAQAEEDDDEEVRVKQKRSAHNYFTKGHSFVPNVGDVTISHFRKTKMAKFDEYFRKFDHSKALNEALNAKVAANHPEVTVAVLEELIRRDTVRAALAGKSDKNLSFLLKFIVKNIADINFSVVIMEVAEMVIDLYTECAENISFENVQLFRRLKKILVQEAKLQLELEKLTGCIQTISRSNAQKIHLNIRKNTKPT